MIDYKFIGWCKEGAHDKVWGVIYLGSSATVTPMTPWPSGRDVMVFWGRRGKKLQYQIKKDDYSLMQLIEKKEQKYRSIPASRLNSVYPEFEADLEKTTVWAELCR